MANDILWDYECTYFWNNLSTTENIDNGHIYSTSGATHILAGDQVPKVNFGNKNTGIFACALSRGPGYTQTGFYNTNVYYIIGFTANGPTNDHLVSPNTETSISAADALSVDKKTDDGVADAGNIVAGGSGVGSPDLWTIDNSAGSGCISNSDASKYNAGSTGAYPCSLVARINSQTAD